MLLVYIRQDGLSGTPVYVGLHKFTLMGREVELDNRDKTGRSQGKEKHKTPIRLGQDRAKTRTR